MKKFRLLFFAVISTMFLTACHSQKDGTPQKQNSGNNIESEKQVETNDNSEQISFVMNDINGNPVSVKDEFHKYKLTVIDFWASWCGPCRQEMPSLVRIYNKYKKQGLGIIGVSLDENESQWKSATKEMEMSWLQLSDLQGWNNSAAQMYGIQAIPFTIIVDQDGNILNAGLRGNDLEDFIYSYLTGQNKK